MRKITALILTLVLICGLACTAFAATPLSFAGKVQINVGETTRWTANQWVWWTSGNPGVATIDQQGNIKALKAGISNITATAADGTKKTVAITVTTPYPTSISYSGKTTMYVGTKMKFNIDFYPSTATNKWLTYSSGNPGVASIDKDGNIIAFKAGQANITATTANGLKKTVLITVYNSYHTAYSLNASYDAVDKVATYKPKNFPIYVGERNFVLPYIILSEKEKNYIITFHYTGDKMISWTDLTIYADGKTYTHNVKSYQVYKDFFSNNRRSAYANLRITEASQIEMLNKIANASYAYVTFSGSDGTYTHVINDADKQAFKNVIAAYGQMG